MTQTGATVRVLLDLRGAQPVHAQLTGGIHRYLVNLTAAMLDRSDVELHGLIDDERPLPEGAAALALSGRLYVAGAEVPLDPPFVHHIGALFDLNIDALTLVPGSLAREGVARVVTAYDAIPLASSVYDPRLRQRWAARAAVLRRCDLALAISDAAAGEVARFAHLDPRRIRVVSTGVPQHGKYPRASLPGLVDEFILYTGGTADPRKNVDALVRAYTHLPGPLMASTQLVIASSISDERRSALLAIAQAGGAHDRVVVAGRVADDVLGSLYEHAALFVYPSRHEGFGLPIAEAMAAGTAVISGNRGATADLHGHPDGSVDPDDEAGLAAAMERALSDPGVKERLRRWGTARAAAHTWAAVAERTVAAYREALSICARRLARPRPQSGSPMLVSWATPRIGSPAGAMLAMAISGGRAVRLATSIPAASRLVGARAIGVERIGASLTHDPAEVICSIEAVAELPAAVAVLRLHRVTLVLWELDRLMPSSRDVPVGLAGAIMAAAVVVVRDELDAWRLRTRFGHTNIVVCPPPAPWPPPVPAAPTLLGAATTAAERDDVRRARAIPHVLAFTPARFGPVSEITVSRAAAIAAALDVRVTVLGELNEETRGVVTRWQPRGRRLRLLMGGDPDASELLAAITTSDAIMALDPAAHSAGEALADLALACGRPVIATHPGPRRDGVNRLPAASGLAEILEAVAAHVANRGSSSVASGPRPEATLATLLGAVRTVRGAGSRSEILAPGRGADPLAL